MLHVVVLSIFLVFGGNCSKMSSSSAIAEQSADDIIKPITIDEINKVLTRYQLPRDTSTDRGLCIIGLDGFSPRLIKHMIGTGKMPHLEKLVSSSAWGSLQSTVFQSSVVAWTSAFTGQSLERHGITSFFVTRQKDGMLSLINSDYRAQKAIWEYMDSAERTSLIINVPGTYPPDPVSGIMISGLLTPIGKVFTYPSELSRPLKKLSYKTSIKPFRQTFMLGQGGFEKSYKTLNLDEIFTITYNQAKMAIYLYQRIQPDLFVIVFTLPDRIQHALHYFQEDIIEQACQNLDIILGHLLTIKRTEAPVILLSDHGFKKYEKAFAPNKWLQNKGLLKIKNETISLSETKVFASSVAGNHCSFRLNIEGRDHFGCIPKDTIDSFKSSFINELRSCRSPLDHRNIVLNIYQPQSPPSEFKYSDDFIVQLDPAYKAIPALNLPRVYLKLDPPIYDHDLEGFFMINGSGIRPQYTSASIQDIAPTALYLMQSPIPSDMEGSLLKKMFTQEHLQNYPPKYQDINTNRSTTIRNDSEKTDTKVMTLLKSLGYIQ